MTNYTNRQKIAFALPIAVFSAFAVVWMLLNGDVPDVRVASVQTPLSSGVFANDISFAAPSKTVSSTPPLNVRLTGVVESIDERSSLALLSVNGFQEVIVRVGESFGENAVVVAIDKDSMTYLQGALEIRTAVQSGAGDLKKISQQASETPPSNNLQASSGETIKLPGFMPLASVVRQGDVEAPNGNAIFKRDIEQRLATMKQLP